ncbi:uncharacterized protein BDW47DRAFT_130202 [Aspergillus candidus]|uniref:Uncharacterized protein n=1 Tax=Aspergillus candidus TaxID=41067 RepID=A0A2I2EXP6_ASPCN|nr:hypothetical protein BDW47DRAFT_130202 [Aspergillus candidus]PLB33131.1 hypothetical protein BDW47DRAFT_130202 [Aspergillus candidus]
MSRSIRGQPYGVLRRETNIPVPDVYDFSGTRDNELNCPFTLMEYISWIPLMEAWFDEEVSPAEAEKRRTRALADLVAAIVQLDRYRFDQVGLAVFGADGRISGTDITNRMKPNATNDKIAESLPLLTPKLYVAWRLHEMDMSPDDPVRGAVNLLKMLLDWIPNPADNGKGPFVLAQMKIGANKILVGPDGAIQAILGWEAAEVIPRAIGNDAYPP